MKLVVLDRDGVINQMREQPIISVDEWEPIEGSIEAIARLSQASYRIVVAVNQASIGKGDLSIETLHEINAKMQQTVSSGGGSIDAMFFCPHVADDDCNCRKPRAGLLDSIMDRLDQELTGVPVVGDSLRDLQAAMIVGARPVLVRTGHGSATLAQNRHLENVSVFDDLAAFVDDLLAPKYANADKSDEKKVDKKTAKKPVRKAEKKGDKK